MRLFGRQPRRGPDLTVDAADADPAPRPASTSLRSLLFDAGVYGTGMVLARGLGIFLTPVLARSLSATEFGVLDLVQTGALLASMLLSLQLESAVLRYFQTGAESERNRLLSTALAMNVAAGALLIVLAAGVAPFVGAWISPVALTLAATSVLTGFLYTHALTVLRAERQAPRAAGIIAVNTTLNLGGVVALVAFGGIGVAGVFGARVLADALSAIGVLAGRRSHYSLAAIHREEALRLFKFGAPLTPEGFLTFASAHVGKAVLLSYGTLAELGLLAVANRIAMVVKLTLASLRQAWLPYAFSIADRTDADVTYARALSGYMLVSGPLFLGFVLLAPEALLIFAGRDYLPAQRILAPLAAAAVIAGLPYIFNVALLLEEKTSKYTVAVVIAFLTTVTASLLLIPPFGVVGAAMAGLATSVASAGSVLYFAHRARRIPYSFKLLYGFVAGLAGVGLAGAFGWLEFPLSVRLPFLTIVAIAGGSALRHARRLRQRTQS